jgi:hypothetical protein
MDRVPVRGWGVAAAAVIVVLAACDKPPSDPGIPSAMCTPRCERDHACDATVDVSDCVTKCEHLLGPRAVYERQDWVGAVRACAQQQACVQDTDGAILRCQRDAWRRLAPSPAALRFCRTFVSRQDACNVSASRRRDNDHCLQWHQMYSDAILDRLTDCEEQPCRVHGACFDAVVGEDPADDDPNVLRQRTQGRIPDAGSPTVTLHGRVRTESKDPIPGAAVCLRESQQPCVTTDASGEFTIDLPAHQEIAIAITAQGFAARLFATNTVGQSIRDWNFQLPTATFEAARYAKVGQSAPDPQSASLVATAQAPSGVGHDMTGVEISIDPRAKIGPVYLAEDGAPDSSLVATSTYGDAVFAGVAPGVVELTMGPADVVCVPSFGGWPTSRQGSVRVPVVAGFETVVWMRCHR